MAELIIGGIIAIYCIYLTVRKIRKIKKGEWCSCGCGGSCPGCPNQKEKGE